MKRIAGLLCLLLLTAPAAAQAKERPMQLDDLVKFKRVSDPVWARDGKRLAFVSAVWPEYSAKPFKESDALNKKRADEQEAGPVKARVFTRLFYRHWDDYVEDKRQHLFVCDFTGGKASEPRDVTPGDYDANPTSTTFSSDRDY